MPFIFAYSCGRGQSHIPLRYMRELGKIEAKKSLGQNFLTNPKVPEWMADAASLKAGGTVVEIGPGTGMLTREFLKRGAKTIAIEADSRAIDVLSETFKDELEKGQLVLMHADIREVDLKELGVDCGGYKLIANIPYYLSGFLFRTILEGECQPETLVFLIQKEVAIRIVRDPKESLLSLGIKAYGVPSYIKTISRGNFTPQPNVDSAIIKIGEISKKRFKNVTEVDFFKLLHLGFAAKRKQLLGNLSQTWDRERLSNTFSTLGLPQDIRAEDIPLEQWFLLASALYGD